MSATSPSTDAVSVFNVDDYLPNYYEMQATIKAIKPTGGVKANAYLIFDYSVARPTSSTPGSTSRTTSSQMGHRTAAGWVVDAFRNTQLKGDQFYNLLLAVNGTTATLTVVGRPRSLTRSPRG